MASVLITGKGNDFCAGGDISTMRPSELDADIVVATSRARFCLSFMRIGLISDAAALFTLPRTVGWGRAKQLLYSTQEINGQTAFEYGVVKELTSPERLQERSLEIA